MKNILNAVLVLILAGSIGWGEYRVQKMETRNAVLQSQVSGNTTMANQAVMMVQNFYDHAPHEIIKLVNATKCDCGQVRPPMITTRGNTD